MLHMFKRNKAAVAESHGTRRILANALAQRSKIDITFDAAESSITGLTATVSEVRAETLILDISGVDRPSGLKGRRINAFFRVRDDDSRSLSCMFSARITEAVQGQVGSVRLVLPLPDKLDHVQRRKSLRLLPRDAWFEDIRIWLGGPEQPEPGPSQLAGKADMGSGGQVRVVDMSAGGIRLFVSRAFSREKAFYPDKGDWLTLHFAFAQEMKNQPSQVWLAGRIVRRMQDPVDRSLELGLEFERTGRRKQPGEAIVWSTVEENASPDLSERIFAWHTQLFRERGE